MLTILAAAAFACNALTIDAPRAYPTGHWIVKTFAADFDGDGWTDVGTYLDRGNFTIRYGTGGGNLSEPVQFALDVVAVADVVGDPLPDLVTHDDGVRENRGGHDFTNAVRYQPLYPFPLVADFTGDRRNDLVVSDGIRYTLVSFATGSALRVSDVELGSFSRDLRAADMDGDGDLDLVGSHTNRSDYAVFTNDGRGHFSAGVLQGLDGWYDFADFDGDGRADRLTALYDDGSYLGLRIYYASGRTAEVALPDQQRPSTFSVHDFDGDGDPDVAIGLQELPGLRIYLNDRGSLSPSAQRVPGTIEAATDYTGDGIPDLLLSLGTAVAVIAGNGDGTFRLPRPVAAPLPAWYVRPVAADLDGNGLDELIYHDAAERRFIVARPDGAGNFAIEPLPPGTTGYAIRASRGEIAIANSDGTIAMYARVANAWELSRKVEGLQLDYNDFELADLNGDGRNELATIVLLEENARSLRVIDSNSGEVLLDQPLAAGQAEYELTLFRGTLIVTLSGTAKVFNGDPPITEVLPDGSISAWTFTPAGAPVQRTVMSGAAFSWTVAGDYNGDARLDVLSSNLVAYGLPNGTFAAPRIVDGIAERRVGGDLNGDGITDLAWSERWFTYVLGSGAGLQPPNGAWVAPGDELPLLARIRAGRPASLLFGTRELIEVTAQCAAGPRRRGVRH
ncbi:MAG TPA: VCBS repeat-containing protein [Thermoanaerobaculia bacterium]|nr:VCBS repeat-containing protein [Thermoanaerobaculia bacterium]